MRNQGYQQASEQTRSRKLWAVIALLVISLHMSVVSAQEWVPDKSAGCLRVATYNVSLNRGEQGVLQSDLESGNEQAHALAAVIRAVQPDILLLNEVDFEQGAGNAELFLKKYVEAKEPDALGLGAWGLPYVYDAAVNTGVPSGLDLNNNDRVDDAEDAWGYGRFPGQYGMAVASRFPIDESQVRTLQEFRWSRMPDALRPQLPSGEFYYGDDTWARLRLSSKSFWDVPVNTPRGKVHVLASHPTPPAFDGPEDRNGCRNHDEIRLIQEYIDGAAYLQDDRGKAGGIASDSPFVVMGDLNSDPNDGGSKPEAIQSLLTHARIAQFGPPASPGGRAAAESQGNANHGHQGNPAFDTGDFNDRSVGNLRVDYVLPSTEFAVNAAGVFWPALDGVPEDRRAALQASLEASDHHLVWVDVVVAKD